MKETADIVNFLCVVAGVLGVFGVAYLALQGLVLLDEMERYRK